jgi:anti-sigma regulatory factor (Ser/Thr protein kinase)
MTPATGRWEAPATPDHVAGLRRNVARFAQTQGFDDLRAADVALAVSEALTNVVLHAYRDFGDAGRMTAAAYINGDDMLVVDITDDGVGIVPNPESPGLGLGLPIMRQVSDVLELGPEAGPGAQVRLSFGR